MYIVRDQVLDQFYDKLVKYIAYKLLLEILWCVTFGWASGCFVQ